ncbi:MAG: acyl-ACP--UDP-N-acetylglucosamine O-acyltransferase [Gammaproteobacteria bacterium]|nr:acyl-ACP--UDP-N-acetylglucosamine O-acyltransferase [Gammaproteobacteria bacterium]
MYITGSLILIHPSAIIDDSAEIADDVSIGPFSVIGPDVSIGRGTSIASHVVIKQSTRVGEDNKILQFSSIGEDPQDKKYAGEESFLEIGDRNVIREYVTLNRGTSQDAVTTRIGSDNLLMAYTHVAHDCQVGNHTILANAASLGGHVHVEDWAILGGFTIVHQFCRIGAHCFAAMGSAIAKDVLPFTMLGGQPAKPHGINKEGLKRRGFSEQQLKNILSAYKLIYKSGLPLEQAKTELADLARHNGEAVVISEFLNSCTRSIIR